MKTTQISKTTEGTDIIVTHADVPRHSVRLSPTAPGRDYSRWQVLCSASGVLMTHLSGKTFKSQKTAEARAIEWLESKAV